MRWIDLSKNKMRLLVAALPSGNKVLVLEGAERHPESAQRLGFQRMKSGTWIKKGTQYSPAAFVQEFPDAAMIEVDPHDFTVRPKASSEKQKAAPQARKAPDGRAPARGGPASGRRGRDAAQVEVMLAQARHLGLNRLGQEVYEGDEGRFIKDAKGRPTFEDDLASPTPGLFLRASDEPALAMCAEGLVAEAVQKGKVLRAEDLARFLEAAHGEKVADDDERVAHACAAIAGAAARWLARKGGASMRDVFSGAVRLHENLSFLSSTPREDEGAGRLPLPLAVVAQRILGTESDLIGRTVVVPKAGTGALLAHLPKGATVRAHEPDAALHEHAKATASAAGTRGDFLSSSAADYEGADMVIAALERSLLDRPLRLDDGTTVTRADLSEAVDSLEARASDGRSVFILEGGQGPEDEAEMEAFLAWVGRHYAIEGTADVDGALYCGRPEAAPLRLMVAGRRRPTVLDETPEPALRRNDVHDFAALWTWTAEVVSNRAKVADYYDRDEEAIELADADPDLVHNAYQTPYVSASRVGTPTTMIPRNLEGAAREALSRVARAHKDVDQWVANEFAYSKENLAANFSPEQVDALALWLHAQERKRGFLLADDTGIGKGRSLAAIMRRAAMRGMKVLFLTERATNLSDIWRDVVHTGSDAEFAAIVLNDGTAIIDEATGDTLLRSAPRREVAEMIRSRSWPEDTNLVMGTYSQFNKASSASDKSLWLCEAIDGDTVVVLDECHNAASGESNVSANVAEAVKRAGAVTYSSATFAKNAKTMAFYAPLFPDGMSTEELAEIMRKGGETLQEVVSTMLVQDGVMVRREHDLSNVEFETVPDTERFDRNRGYMDLLAPILAEMAYLSGDLDRRINKMNDRIAAQAGAQEDTPRDRRAARSLQVTRIGFGSPLYTLSRLFIAALKVDKAVDEALTVLRGNQKPIILVENTVQALLEEMAETEDDADGSASPDFKALMHRAVSQMTMASRVDDSGQRVRVDLAAGDANMRGTVEGIRRMIDALPDLPASAIDAVKERINDSGFVCDEITGRSLECVGGRIRRRRGMDKTVVKNAFNAGDIDALVVNVAGCTGIDLHAGARFADQRQRVLIELQAPSDITRQIQAYGRVNRYDQVVGPKIVAIASGLPIEMRLDAMRNAKLRRMSANVTSNRDSSVIIKNIPDLINSVGDVVCTRYAEARPDLMRRLGFDVQRNARVEVRNRGEGGLDDSVDTKRSANELLARLVMLPVALQEQVANELAAEYSATMEELEAKGETPLRTKELHGIVHVRRRGVFEGAETDQPTSVFHEPLYSLEIAIERTAEPIKADDVTQAMEIGMMSGDSGEIIAERIERHREDILTPYLPREAPTVRDALAMNVADVVSQNERLDLLAESLRSVRPGREVRFSVEGEVMSGIVTAVQYPPRGYEHVASFCTVVLACPGDVRIRRIKMETLIRDEGFEVADGLEGEDYDAILQRFDDALASKLTPGILLTHNIFRGMRLNVQHKLGSLVAYQLDDGTRHRGILVSRKFKNIDFLPVGMSGPDMAAAAFMEAGAELRGSSDMSVRAIALSRLKSGSISLYLPPRRSRKYGVIYEHPPAEALLRRSVSEGKAPPRIPLTPEEVPEVLRILSDAGVRFWISGKHRKWAGEWARDNMVAMEGPDVRGAA